MYGNGIIKRDEYREVIKIKKVNAETIGEFASANSVGAIVGRSYNDFDTPVYLHPDSAMELEEAGIIEMTEPNYIYVKGFQVFLYVGV